MLSHKICYDKVEKVLNGVEYSVKIAFRKWHNRVSVSEIISLPRFLVQERQN